MHQSAREDDSIDMLSDRTFLPRETVPFRRAEIAEGEWEGRQAVMNAILSSETTQEVTPRGNLYKFSVPIENLPEEFQGFKVLHLSDIHFHRHSPRRTEDFEKLAKFLEQNGVKVDLVVVTGDTVTDAPEDFSAAAQSALKAIGGDADKFFVLGNHDYYNGSVDSVREGFTAAGFGELTNRTAKIVRGGAEIFLYGTDDYLKGNPLPPEQGAIPSEAVALLLTHNLDALQVHFPDSFDLALSGHLHAGEIKLGPIDGVLVMKLMGHSANLNDHIVGWDFLSNRCRSYVSPGQARHYVNFNTTKPGATIIELVRRD